MDELEHFRSFLKQRGHKLTQQRDVILRRVLEIDRHFSAEDLLADFQGSDQGISKATVYRTLALLVDAGVLEALDFERGHMLYERASARHHHDHLVCLACHRIDEFHDEEIERLQEQIARRYGFATVSHTHHIYGVCRRCQEKGVDPEEVAQSRASARLPRGEG